MSKELQKSKELAQRWISNLPFVHSADDNLEMARQRMMLAFSPAASIQLNECTPESIGHCIALSALSGLMPGGSAPDVWLIPRRRNIAAKGEPKRYVLEAAWQIASRGYVRMARDSGYELDAAVVYHGEEFRATRGDRPRLFHEPNVDAEYLDTKDDDKKNWKSVRCAYVVATKPGQAPRFLVMRKEQIAQRRAKAQDDNIWKEWLEEQILKTVKAYGGRQELWDCSPSQRHVIHADVTEPMDPQEVKATVEPPPILESDFAAPVGIPEDPEKETEKK